MFHNSVKLLLQKNTTTASTTTSRTIRYFTSPPGSNPLGVLLKSSIARNLCGADGRALDGKHFVMTVAVALGDEDEQELAPNLRTIGLQRVSNSGIDFVMKNGSKTVDVLQAKAGTPMAILHTQGKYLPGEKVEQWRGEGSCEPLQLSELLEKVPGYTITGMVASKRIEQEANLNDDGGSSDDVSLGRKPVLNKSHLIEIVQKTRREWESGNISSDEIEQAIQAFRFIPNRMERMTGSPDAVLWDRWEWLSSGSGAWDEPQQLLPY